ncbi:hypothetical protein CXG81DRAFT_10727 [Caulochytrium protostelioides]|uniref:Acetyl-CoA synthetase-like protein n=1 Tax=Caulochytrium protostelioides TaxID=1555241 RepID=A0A4V1ITL3_9FUNG|nr:acetyl-CoA synthetase-like protein [Caulochytrium protostelioides]RKP02488.1 hypothetical protein CXG81DRAFT_10727 [Caulochytrium protostelioides]|eukprot:RKP02488.1 hypothetical protein CXG81DRAFT_10727 [Caulochytrium protostelioides]
MAGVTPTVLDPVLGIPYFSSETLAAIQRSGPVAVEIPGTRTQSNETGIYRSVLSPARLLDGTPSARTASGLFSSMAKHYANVPCLGYRPMRLLPDGTVTWDNHFEWQDYATIERRRIHIGQGILETWIQHLGGQATDVFHVGLYGQNSRELLLTDLACGSQKLPSVAIYDTLGPTAAEFIIRHGECPIVAATASKLPGLLATASRCPNFRGIIVLDSGVNPLAPTQITAARPWAAEKGLAIWTLEEIEALGAQSALGPRPPQPDDLAVISYTSGTTGDPKGAMLSQRNLVSVALSVHTQSPRMSPGDKYLSHLPLAHVFEKLTVWFVFGFGGSIGFCRGDTALLMEDVQLLQPTLFVSVPRLFNRVYDKIIAGAQASPFKAWAMARALVAKRTRFLQTGDLHHALWDRLVFGKVRAALGGKTRYMLTGSAPIHRDVVTFLRLAFGARMAEGYGQTESAAGLTISFFESRDAGNVGGPLVCNEIKLVDCPENQYFVTDQPYPRGEIWVRGHNIFQGYYKDPVKTAEALTSDGWLKTGDIGQIDAQGRLTLIDRKKNIFKLSQGEYVAPEKIESSYLKSPWVAQIFVHGDSLRNELVAVIVPDFDQLAPHAVAQGWLRASDAPAPGTATPVPTPAALVELTAKPEVRDMIQRDLDRVARSEKLRGFEIVRRIHLAAQPMTIEQDLMTPTMKIKRAQAAKVFRPQIDALYAELEADSNSAASATVSQAASTGMTIVDGIKAKL